MRIVQKYGGSSLASPDHVGVVARRVAAQCAQGDEVVVVVSAMGNKTDELVALAHAVNPTPSSREMDMLLSTGETVSAPLLAMALEHIGIAAISFTGLQAGIRTSGTHRRAHITGVIPDRLVEALEAGRVPVVAGFQGVTADADITTLGRGGSDTSAVALAVALEAQRCEIFTDVAGVYSADPRLVPNAQLIPEIAYEEMLEFAAVGARVMHPRAVEIGEAFDMPIWVRSSFDTAGLGAGTGTVICRHPAMEDRKKVRGIAHDVDVAKVTIFGVPDRPGIAATLFGAFSARAINVDIVVQNVGRDGLTDVSFTIADTDLTEAQSVLESVVAEVGARSCDTNRAIAKVSVVGAGIRNTPGVFATAFKALADAGINVEMISTSEIHLTCIVAADRIEDSVRALHAAFELEQI